MNLDGASATLDPSTDPGDCDSRYEGELREQVMEAYYPPFMHVFWFVLLDYKFVLGSISPYC